MRKSRFGKIGFAAVSKAGLMAGVNEQTWPDVPPTHWAYESIEAATKK